jgi:hypothetical protein
VIDGGTTTDGSILNLSDSKLPSNGSLTSVNYAGDLGANRVQLSTSLTKSGIVSADFGADDGIGDTLIFNVGDSSTYASFNASGSVATGPETFAFNTISGFSLVDLSDRLGIFYGGSNLTKAYTELSDLTQASGYRLTDGKVFEDNTVAVGMTSANAKSAAFIAETIAFIINQGGVAAPGTVGKASATDFIYVAYGESSSDSAKTSAYLYSGYYETSAVVLGKDATIDKVKISALAEIFDVASGDLGGTGGFTSSAFTTTKPTGLT